MIKIRAMGARELKQVLRLLAQFTDEDFRYTALQNFRQLYGPIQQFSLLLPPCWQFVPAIYVAVSHEKVLGLIWLSQDGKKANRWKIEQLIIDPAEFSYDVGAQLVHYVINRYGAEGIQTFLALVHHQYDQAMGLLKSCGFRHVARVHEFILENPAALKLDEVFLNGLRESTRADRYKLKDLHDEFLPADKRIPLEKTPDDFCPSWPGLLANHLKGVFFKRWVVADRAHDLLLGAVSIQTENHRDFYLEVIVSPAWDAGYEDLVIYGIQRVLQHTDNSRIHHRVYDFKKEQLAVAEKIGFTRSHEAQLLVKDYWIPLGDQTSRQSSPILLFSGKPSTAWGR